MFLGNPNSKRYDRNIAFITRVSGMECLYLHEDPVGLFQDIFTGAGNSYR